MNYPKISIVTPSFNQGKYLEQTILSVIGQNYPNLEYIIIDGGSTDGSVEIIKKYEKYLTYWVSEKDEGQSDAINKGLKRTTGDIFNWINSDDYYEKDIFFHLAEIFSDNTISAVCGKSMLFGNNKKMLAEGTFIDKNDLLKTFCMCHIEQPATFFRSKVIREIGLLSACLHYVMDKELWLKYLFRFGIEQIKKINDVFVNFRLHPHSKTSQSNIDFYSEYATLLYSLAKKKKYNVLCKLLEEKYKINTSYFFESDSLDNIDSEVIKRMIIYFLLKRGSLIFTEKDFIHAKQLLRAINFSEYDLYTEEKDWLQKITTNASPLNWTTFRIQRKLNIFLKKQCLYRL